MTDALVAALLANRESGGQMPAPSAARPLSLPEAYAVQDRLRQALADRGERVIGWKAGFTTRAVQESFGCAEPVCGFLLASGVVASGGAVAFTRFVAPAVEAEVAFVMRHDLAGPGVTPPRALLAVEGALPALEIIDVRYRGQAAGADIVADDVYASAIVVGGALTPVASLDLALEGCVYELNGELAATNAGAEVMGSPVNSLAWIANHLGSRGLGLRSGDIVMTGSVSKVLRPKAGDTVRATYTRLGSVAVRFV